MTEMMELIRAWLLGMTGAALFSALALELTPKGAVRGVVYTLCGVLMTAALLSPLQDFSYPTYAAYLYRYRREAAELTERADAAGKEYSRQVIKSRLEAYIVDEAQRIGAETGAVRVTLEWDPEARCWLPTEVTLEKGDKSPWQGELSAWIEGELGIPRGRQRWETAE